MGVEVLNEGLLGVWGGARDRKGRGGRGRGEGGGQGGAVDDGGSHGGGRKDVHGVQVRGHSGAEVGLRVLKGVGGGGGAMGHGPRGGEGKGSRRGRLPR